MNNAFITTVTGDVYEFEIPQAPLVSGAWGQSIYLAWNSLQQ
jgi:hypothetical protein